ncbi:MAG: hypothetical protein ACI89X_001813 [Planctomycetota bacterium]|jgi:hypothetical protein
MVRHIEDLELLRYTTNAPTTIAMIQHAATFPHWPKSLERRALNATTDASAQAFAVRPMRHSQRATAVCRSARGWPTKRASTPMSPYDW